MQAIFVSITGGLFIYFLLHIFIPVSDRSLVKERYSKYFRSPDVDDVHGQVLKERHKNLKAQQSQKMLSKELSNYLSMSGVSLSGKEFITIWSLLTIVPILAVLFLGGHVLTASGIGMMCFSAPPLFIRRSRIKRQEEFSKQLGEALVLMGNCIRSGFSFQQAMESIAKEMQPPISSEFSKTLREIHFGVSMKDALTHMVERVKSQDLDLLVSAVLTSAQVGGNLSDILDVISETVRDRIKIKADVRVLTSSGRTSGMIIGLLPVFIILMLMVLNPQYFGAFFDSSIGKVMMGVSVALELTGFAVINKIVDIKY
jgi:tight adherence protein B